MLVSSTLVAFAAHPRCFGRHALLCVPHFAPIRNVYDSFHYFGISVCFHVAFLTVAVQVKTPRLVCMPVPFAHKHAHADCKAHSHYHIITFYVIGIHVLSSGAVLTALPACMGVWAARLPKYR